MFVELPEPSTETSNLASYGNGKFPKTLKAARPPRRIPIRGTHVTLEPLTAGHAEELWLLASAFPDSWRYMPMGPFDCFAKFMIYTTLIANSQDETIWCVRPHGPHGEPGHAAGWLGLLNTHLANASTELGNIWFPPPFAGTTAATEAKMRLLEYAFETLAFFRVAWKCHPLNANSRHAAERLGFQYEGTSRGNLIIKSARRDSAHYSLLAEEWPARRTALQTWLAPENFDAQGHQKHPLVRPG